MLATTDPTALTMKLNSLSAFVVLLALGILASRAVEGASKEIGKPGACPFIRRGFCLVFEPPRCQSDWQCPKKQKCCQSTCTVECLDPVDPSQPVKVKPGKCPVVIGQCKMADRRDDCLNDSHCQNNFKCCRGMCGKSCFKPE